MAACGCAPPGSVSQTWDLFAPQSELVGQAARGGGGAWALRVLDGQELLSRSAVSAAQAETCSQAQAGTGWAGPRGRPGEEGVSVGGVSGGCA